MTEVNDFLAHYGVKGMKWGVRKSSSSGSPDLSTRKGRLAALKVREMRNVSVTTKNGETLSLEENKNGKLANHLASLSDKRYVASLNYSDFTIKANGKTIGDASFNKVDDDELNLVWLGVNSSQRGNGYGSAVFDAAVKMGKESGVKKLTLEVPGNAPDARHIYEKRGFKVVKEPSKEDLDDAWGGLTHMALDVNQKSVKHADVIDEESDELEVAIEQTYFDLDRTLNRKLGVVEDVKHSAVDAFLAHAGVKGMKWGVRKDDNEGSGSSGSKDSAKGSMSADKRKALEAEAALLAYAKKKGVDPQVLKDKYGDVESDVDNRSFYQRHKTAINVGAGVAVAGLVAYGGYKINENNKEAARKLAEIKELDKLASEEARRKMRERLAREHDAQDPIAAGKRSAEEILAKQAKVNLLTNYNELAGKKAGRVDPDSLDNSPVNLKAGSIMKRVSSNDESTIRPGGFYASFADDDVNRYKAILPTYWRQWGIHTNDGYVVNLRANKDVKAPSRREAFDIFERMLDNDPYLRRTFDPEERERDTRTLASNSFARLAQGWADESNPSTKKYFDEVKKAGYNALVDENDAGALGTRPMRFLDGSMFSLEKADRLTAEDIKNQQIAEARKLGLVD